MTRKTAKVNVELLPEISGLSLDVCRVHATTMIRVTRRPGAELCLDPRKSSGAARYDDFRRPARYAVTYAADDVLAGATEARMLRSVHGTTVISEQHFEQALSVRYEADRELVLLSLTGINVVRLAAADFMWQTDHDQCQRFAAAVHDMRPDVDGIAYPSRKFPSAMCYAIFNRGVRAANLRASHTLSLSAELNAYVESGVIVINASDPGDES